MAATGGRVLALRSVEFARNHGVPVHVRSSFTWEPGTWVAEEDAEAWKQAIISGVTHDTSEAKVTIDQVPDRPGVAAHGVPRARRRRRQRRHDRAERVDRRATPTSRSPCPQRRPARARSTCMEKIVVEIEASGCHTRRRHRPGVAGRRGHEDAIPASPPRCSRCSPTEGVNIEMIRTSTIRISCVVPETDVERAVRALHARVRARERRERMRE